MMGSVFSIYSGTIEAEGTAMGMWFNKKWPETPTLAQV